MTNDKKKNHWDDLVQEIGASPEPSETPEPDAVDQASTESSSDAADEKPAAVDSAFESSTVDDFERQEPEVEETGLTSVEPQVSDLSNSSEPDDDNSSGIIVSDESIKELQIKLFGDLHDPSQSLATTPGDSWSALSNELEIDSTVFEDPIETENRSDDEGETSEDEQESWAAQSWRSQKEEGDEDSISDDTIETEATITSDVADAERDEDQKEDSEEAVAPKKRKRRRRRRGRGSRGEKGKTTDDTEISENRSSSDAETSDELTSIEERSEDDESSAESSTGKRRRRGRRRHSSSNKEKTDTNVDSIEKTDPDFEPLSDEPLSDEDDELSEFDSEETENLQGDSSRKATGNVSHRNLPSWEDAVGFLISGNLATRNKATTKTQSTQKSGSSRGRKRKKKGRGGKP